MWFLYAFLAAVFYALLWIFGRASRGIPNGVVTSMQFIAGPFLLLFISATVDYPWDAWWWRAYLIFPFLINPFVSRMLTAAVHGTEVTLVKPLFGLSSFVTLLVAALFFGEEFSSGGILGVILTTIGLFVLYHERWNAWRERGPWMVLAGAIIFGANAAIVAAVLHLFPEPWALIGLSMTASLIVNAVVSLRTWKNVEWSSRTLFIVLSMATVLLVQEYFTAAALLAGPSAYVVSVKRTSVLITAILGYLFLRERDQSLPRLLLASGLVVAGIATLLVSP